VSACEYEFKTPSGNIRQLNMGSWVASDSSHLENVVVTIHFRQKTAVGSKLTARVDLPTTMMLLKYIRQTQSGSSFKCSSKISPAEGSSIGARPQYQGKRGDFLWLPLQMF
jgi:hypothetical protein